MGLDRAVFSVRYSAETVGRGSGSSINVFQAQCDHGKAGVPSLDELA